MSRRDKKRREQERRKAQQQRRQKPLSPESQAKDNERRVAYMLDNYTRIRDGVEQFKNDHEGQMPAIIMLHAASQQIVIADKLELFVAAMKDVPGLDVEALQRDMVKRDYGEGDCLLLVKAGHGILRTSFANATLRYDCRDSKVRIVSTGM